MKHLKRMLCFALAMMMVFGLVACGGGSDTTAPTGSTESTGNGSGEKVTYTVTVRTNGGMAMEGINVYVYGDAALQDMKGAAATDANGKATFSLAESEYYIQLQGVANGYDVQESYTFRGRNADITLTSSLVKDESITAAVFELGDVMYDFSFTDSEGNQITLSEVLAEKELVVLNFWYTTCSACISEFPILDEAYQMYSDKVEVLGLNSYVLDDETAVALFESSYGLELTFPIGKVSNNFNPQSFINPLTNEGCAGYPTSVFIDRYGVICAIEVGSMTSLSQWASVFDHFVGEEYNQILVNTLDQLIEQIVPTYQQPTTEEILDAAVSGDMTVTFRGEEEEIYDWPFIVTEKDGVTCLKASNQKIYESYAILYADVYLEAGQVFAFDYWASCEAGGDYLHVLVDREAIYSISSVNTEWKSAYCWVAPEDGTYEVALCYIKDSDIDEGDDTVYIDNLRVVTVDDIDSASYIPHQAAVEQADGSYKYATVVYNENDGYYHVGTVDGPLLLANLMGYTQLDQADTVYFMGANGDFIINDYDYMQDILPFCTVASNSSLNGYCTVTKELAELLKIVASVKGFGDDENEWLLVCKYYAAYGTNGEQLQDPCAGLSWFSAFEAVLGNGYVDENGKGQNFFYYDGRPIMPRGMWARFTPAKSGVYRITSHTDYTEGLNAWIFDKEGNMLYEYDGGEMLHGMYADVNNVTMVFYMEAGRDYYIDIAMWDVYGIGYILYDIEYLGATYDLFTSCSPGPFTYDEVSGQTIIRGIDAAIADDGYYHEVLERDENGNPVRFGGIVYAYFTGPTTLFSQSIIRMIELGGFDFGKNEYDQEIIAYLQAYDWDVDATDAYLRELWGEDYNSYAEIYMLEDIYAGIYHGRGEDLTAEMQAYANKIIQGGATNELTGCVAVDARLAELLTMLMDKYTFRNVVDSWQKLCYYYQMMGPEA